MSMKSGRPRMDGRYGALLKVSRELMQGPSVSFAYKSPK
jgi:hypothetical protein